MVCMSLTFPVSNPDRSNDSSEEQPLNIQFMSPTLLVSKPDRSSAASEEQSLNIAAMLVTREVSSLERSQKAMRSNPENHRAVDSGAMPSSTTSTVSTSRS